MDMAGGPGRILNNVPGRDETGLKFSKSFTFDENVFVIFPSIITRYINRKVEMLLPLIDFMVYLYIFEKLKRRNEI